MHCGIVCKFDSKSKVFISTHILYSIMYTIYNTYNAQTVKYHRLHIFMDWLADCHSTNLYTLLINGCNICVIFSHPQFSFSFSFSLFLSFFLSIVLALALYRICGCDRYSYRCCNEEPLWWLHQTHEIPTVSFSLCFVFIWFWCCCFSWCIFNLKSSLCCAGLGSSMLCVHSSHAVIIFLGIY